jgi:hypothetical protein
MVGGGLIGSGVGLADAVAAWVVGLGGVALGGLLGLSMWMTGIAPRLKSALFVPISLALLWGYGALLALALVQEALKVVTGTQPGSSGMGLLAAAVGLAAGLTAQVWYSRRNRGKPNPDAAADPPRG